MLTLTRRSPSASPSVLELFDSLTRNPMLNSTNASGTFPVDVSQNDGEYVIRASLPGFKKDDIDVQLHDGVLSISAEYGDGCEKDDEKYFRRERYCGAVRRRMTLPGQVAASKAAASLDDGVLTLHIPLADEAKPKQIDVK